MSGSDGGEHTTSTPAAWGTGCSGTYVAFRRLRFSGGRQPGLAVWTPDDPQDGSTFGAPGPRHGAFLVPSRGTVRQAAAATVPATSEEEFVARPGRRQTGARRTAPRNQR